MNNLTKREWFAGLAMQALLSNSHKDVVAAFASNPNLAAAKIAESAVEFADETIKFLEATNERI